MADDESLITPDMEASIGTEGDPVTISINPELVRRLVESLEEEDADVLAAVESDDPNAEIPAYALITAATRQRQLTVPDVPKRGLMAADEWRVEGAIHMGDTLTITPRIAEIQERIGGRVGHSLFVHHEWVYENQHGDVVARVRRTTAHFKDKHSGE
jgi:hypothetical protein